MSDDTEIKAELQRVLQDFDSSLEPILPNEAVELFVSNEKSKLAPNTLKEYKKELQRFANYCDRNDVEDSTEFDGRLLYEYKIWRRDEGHAGEGSLSNKTMRDEVYLLRKFIRFLESIDGVTPRLHEKIEIPTLEPGDGVRDIEFTSEEVDSVLSYLDKYEYATREHVVWVYFSAMGRRIGGLRSIDCGDLHLDKDDPYVDFTHRPGETRLKNGIKSETTVSLSESAAEVFQDFIDMNRVEVEVNGREPFLSSKRSKDGRLSDSTIRKYVYKWSRPCVIGKECPEGRDKSECEAMKSSDHASKCPYSKPPVAHRHGYISTLLRQGVPPKVISDRCDVGMETIEKHYSELTDEEKRQLRREQLDNNLDSDVGFL